MSKRETLEELRERIAETEGLPIEEAERALGGKRPTDGFLGIGKLLCGFGLHNRDIVAGAGHGERHIGCVRPSCMRILG